MIHAMPLPLRLCTLFYSSLIPARISHSASPTWLPVSSILCLLLSSALFSAPLYLVSPYSVTCSLSYLIRISIRLPSSHSHPAVDRLYVPAVSYARPLRSMRRCSFSFRSPMSMPPMSSVTPCRYPFGYHLSLSLSSVASGPLLLDKLHPSAHPYRRCLGSQLHLSVFVSSHCSWIVGLLVCFFALMSP
jgi:hypothetical protein